MTMHDGHDHRHDDHSHDPAPAPTLDAASMEGEDSHYFDHIYLSAGHDENAKRTLWVVWLTAATMVVESVA